VEPGDLRLGVVVIELQAVVKREGIFEHKPRDAARGAWCVFTARALILPCVAWYVFKQKGPLLQTNRATSYVSQNLDHNTVHAGLRDVEASMPKPARFVQSF